MWLTCLWIRQIDYHFSSRGTSRLAVMVSVVCIYAKLILEIVYQGHFFWLKILMYYHPQRLWQVWGVVSWWLHQCDWEWSKQNQEILLSGMKILQKYYWKSKFILYMYLPKFIFFECLSHSIDFSHLLYFQCIRHTSL